MNMKTNINLHWSLLLACLVSSAAAAENYLSPSAVVASSDGKQLYIAEATAGQVAVFDVAAGKVAQTWKLPAKPTGLALAPDGGRLFVTCGVADGRVEILQLSDGTSVGSLKAGHSPAAPVASPDGQRLYVCNRFLNQVAIFDLTARKEVARVPVAREPVAAALTPDGKYLFVANLLPTQPADQDYVSAVVSVIDTATAKVVANIQLPNGSTSLQSVCVSRDGRYAYVVHTLSRYQLPTTQLERGWMNTSALTVIDVAAKKRLNTPLLDDVDLGAANPSGVACTADGRNVLVTHSGTHELSVIDQAALLDKLNRVAKGEKVTEVSATPDDVPNDLSFMYSLRKRIKLTGNGPRGLVAIGRQVYTVEYFSDTMSVVDLDTEGYKQVRKIALGPELPLSQVRKGEMFFHDADLCFQHWQSCATCHPDVRVDALNWDLLNDGLGNPKNTKNMLLAHRTPPAMSLGVRDTAETAVRAGIRSIQFAVRPDADAVAIDEFLKSLQPVPSPRLVNGQLSKAAERGKKIFEGGAGCTTCHPSPLFTNLNQYDVGTGRDREAYMAMDTPTLVEVWRTAPYLHDGRAATIQDIFQKYNIGDQHGTTSNLTAQELNDLAEYVLSQ